MIIWLASYPRSGNTLLRTVLKQTMGLDSYSDERPIVTFTEAAKGEFGYVLPSEPWEAFYKSASVSSEIYLVKTHLPPQDDQPAIYIVRDGRRSLVSYHKYHQQFLGKQALSQLALVLDADYYGGWSEHYRNWVSSSRKTLLLRYEDLVNASPDLLKSIAQFIGYGGQVLDWGNPFERLHKENPNFFRHGESAWQGAPGWTPQINALFFLLHGDLMKMLGYTEQEAIEKERVLLTTELVDCVELVKSLQKQNKALEGICRERLSVINVLDKEVKRLKELCLQPQSIFKRMVSWRV